MKMTLNKRTFLAWEGLRVLFLILLGVETVRGLRPLSGQLPVHEVVHMVVGALLLNVLFLLGPVAESLLPFGGWKRIAVRVALFAAGTWLCVLAVGLYIGGLHEIFIGRD